MSKGKDRNENEKVAKVEAPAGTAEEDDASTEPNTEDTVPAGATGENDTSTEPNAEDEAPADPASKSAGHYSEIVPQYSDDDEKDMFAIAFRRTSSQPVPLEMEQLIERANAAVTFIRNHFPTHKDRQHWQHLITITSHFGTVGVNADPVSALKTFGRIEDTLVSASRPLRRIYILKLFASFFSTLIFTSAFYFLLQDSHYLFSTINTNLGTGTGGALIGVLKIQLMTIVGLAVGVLFSGISQNRILSYERLGKFDPNGFSTYERLLYVWIIATVLEAFLYFEVVTLGLGGVDFAKVSERHSLGFLIGLITAISTEYIAETVSGASKPSKGNSNQQSSKE